MTMSFVALCVLLSPALPATAATLPALWVREIKIKGDDFMVLQASVPVQLSDYWLGYASDPTENITPEYQLASGTLRPGESVILVGDSAVPTCDAVLAMDMPVALAETKGVLALWLQSRSADGKSITFSYTDGLTWTNAKTGLADIVRPAAVEEGLATPTWFRELDVDLQQWQVGDLSDDDELGCVLRSRTQDILGVYTSTPDADPPAVIEDDDETGGLFTSGNVGLLAPQITELLPNPPGTGTDATDEFIELYNPNASEFDLSGYELQTGLTTKHSFVLPEGSVLAPLSFTSFTASQTGLSMSNTSGQAALLDPDGTVIAMSDPYGTAADGKAWAIADGTWYWTNIPSAGSSNVIASTPITAAVATTKKTVKAAKATTQKTTVAKATKTSAAKKKVATTTAAVAKIASEATKPVRGIHPLVLALVALAALGYGVYEYRHDVANAIHKYRTNRAARRSHRQ